MSPTPDATLKPGDPFHIRYGVPVINQLAMIVRAMANEVLEGRGDEGGILCDFTNIPEEAWMAEPKGIAGLHIMRNFDWIKDIGIKKTNGEMKLYTMPIRRGYVKIPEGRTPIKGLKQVKGD